MKTIFVSSALRELAAERRLIINFIQRDPQLHEAFRLYIPENISGEPQQKERSDVLKECDVFIGIIGNGSEETVQNELPLVETEIEHAIELRKFCLILVKGLNDNRRNLRMTALIRRVGAKMQYRRFRNQTEFEVALRDGLLPQLRRLTGELDVIEDEDEHKYEVFFAKNAPGRHPDVPTPSIIFSPVSDSANEFNLRTRFNFSVLETDIKPIQGELHLAFVETELENESPANRVESYLAQSSHSLVSGSELPEFYTLQTNIEAYRKLIRNLGDSRARDLLMAINDLVVLNRAHKRPDWLEDAMNSDQFNFSFMRNSETYFALRHAESLLGGLDEEELSGISKNLHLSFKLPTFQNNHEIQFHFEHDGPLPSRIAVVIGKNGVGKSQTLAHLVEALLRGDTNSLRDTLEGRPVINRLLAVSSPGETYTTFPPVPRFPGRINYRRIFLSRRQFGNKELGLGQVLVELSRSEESIKSRGRWNLFCETIRSIVPPEELFMRVKNSGKAVTPQWLREPFPLIELQEGNSRRRLERWSAVDLQADVCRYIGGEVIPLSSGQLTFIRFAVQACLYVENGTLFLCDEPETHLHPNYISAFIGLLDRLLAETGSFAILATHSAYFVREVARSQVIVLRQTKDRQIEVVTPRLKTLGADIGEISHFVFEDTYFGSLLGQVRGRLIADPEQAANVLETLESEVSTEALMSLQRELPPAAK